MLPTPFKYALIATTIIGCAPAIAAAHDGVHFSGFGNVSAIHSGTKDFGYIYDLTKEGVFDTWSLKTGSSIGLQMNTSLTDNLDAVIQGVVQDRINNDLNKTITWAFLRYNASPDLTIRVGRIATPLYMLSEYRDVGFAYLWTKPITDFYSNIPVTTLDGGDIAYTTPFMDGMLETRFYAGQSEVAIDNVTNTTDVTLSPLFGTRLTYYIDRWTFSGSAATVKNKKGEPAAQLSALFSQDPSIFYAWPSLQSTLNDFQFVDTRFYYYSLGAHYETGDWNVQSELSYSDAEWPFFPDLAAGYISVGKAFDSSTVYGFASKAKSVGDLYTVEAPPAISLLVPQIASAYQTLKGAVSARTINQETLGFGVRYDINTQLSLKGQIERTWLLDNKFGAWSYSLEGINAPVPDHIDTISISLSFVF